MAISIRVYIGLRERLGETEIAIGGLTHLRQHRLRQHRQHRRRL
jgi:hypothetical protein